MIAKTFEIRDAATFIPVLAVKLRPGTEADRYLLGCAGYGITPDDQAGYLLMCRIDGGGGLVCSDPFDWAGGARTMPTAHRYIAKHFDEMESGAVVDVEFICGERQEPKKSQRGMAPL